MKNPVLSLLVLLLPVGAGAQPTQGMLLVEGVWQIPTPATALRAFVEHENPDADRAAVAVLRQVFNTRPAAELDAFAAELRRLVLEGTSAQSFRAQLALVFAAADSYGGGGTPYAGAVDVFIRVYESLQSRADPRAYGVLGGVFVTGGAEYVRNLFKASEQPSKPCFQPHTPEVEPPPKEEWCPNLSAWCQAGRVLLYYGRDAPDPAAPDPEVWTPVCYLYR